MLKHFVRATVVVALTLGGGFAALAQDDGGDAPSYDASADAPAPAQDVTAGDPPSDPVLPDAPADSPAPVDNPAIDNPAPADNPAPSDPAPVNDPTADPSTAPAPATPDPAADPFTTPAPAPTDPAANPSTPTPAGDMLAGDPILGQSATQSPFTQTVGDPGSVPVMAQADANALAANPNDPAATAALAQPADPNAPATSTDLTSGVPLAAAATTTTDASAVAANPLNNANYAQSWYGERFSDGGKFSGQTIDQVAEQLRNGTLKPSEVPIDYVTNPDGSTVMANTRSAQALERAGIPRDQWVGNDITGDPEAAGRVEAQLARNGLPPEGTPSTVTKAEFNAAQTATSDTTATVADQAATRTAATTTADAAASEASWLGRAAGWGGKALAFAGSLPFQAALFYFMSTSPAY